MRIDGFEESNRVIGEGDMRMDIHVTDDENNRIIFCWKLNFFERLVVLFTGRIWQQSLLYRYDLQETAITVEKPFMEKKSKR